MADRAADQMSRMSLKPTLLEKRAPGTLGTPIQVTSNLTPLTVEKNINYFQYELRSYAVIERMDGASIGRELTINTSDDHYEQERKTASVQILLELTKQFPQEFPDASNLIYDRASVLFSTRRLPGITKKETTFLLPAHLQTICKDATCVRVTIKEAEFAQVSSNDLRDSVNADFRGGSKSLMQVLDLITSQHAFFNPADFVTYGNGAIYLMDPLSHGFKPQEAPLIGKDKYTAIGLSKSVKLVEGPNNNTVPALVLDVKKTAFHNDHQNLSDKIFSMYKFLPASEVLTRELKDLRCRLTHKKGCSIVIDGFTAGPIKDAKFKDRDGKTLNLVDYYEQKFKLKIKYGELPGVIDKMRRNVYPPELLEVAKNQRVKGTQATRETVDTIIKVAAIKPEQRLQQTQELAQLLQLNSRETQRLGVSVPAKELEVPARQLPPVTLQGGVRDKMVGPSWRSSPQFFVGASLQKWAAFLIYNSNSQFPREPATVFQKFLIMFCNAGKAKGMRLADPMGTDMFDARNQVESDIAAAIKRAVKAGCVYILVISDKDVKRHDQLKHEELYFQITTQEVTLQTAAKVVNERKVQTLENIVLKANAKLSGINHVLADDNSLIHGMSACIMGIFVQAPRRMSPRDIEEGRLSMPAVIGMSVNNGYLGEEREAREVAAKQYFTTRWQYAHPVEWQNGVLQKDTMKRMVKEALRLYSVNRGRVPNEVIVYRGGTSEGQLPYIASVERDMFMEAFNELREGYDPTLVLIAATKDHNERFFHKEFPRSAPHQRPVDTNLPAGTVVDTVAVNPELNEFFLQSHKALQGTAKAVKYTVLHESSGKMSNDDLQHMTNSLCHLHQVVNSSTSIPTPLYVAEESAKRGVNLYQHMRGASAGYNLDEVNRELGLGDCSARINA